MDTPSTVTPLSQQAESLWLDGDDAWSKASGQAPYWKLPEERKNFARMAYLAGAGVHPDDLEKNGVGPYRMMLAEKWGDPAVATDDAALDAGMQLRLTRQRTRRTVLNKVAEEASSHAFSIAPKSYQEWLQGGGAAVLGGASDEKAVNIQDVERQFLAVSKAQEARVSPFREQAKRLHGVLSTFDEGEQAKYAATAEINAFTALDSDQRGILLELVRQHATGGGKPGEGDVQDNGSGTLAKAGKAGLRAAVGIGSMTKASLPEWYSGDSAEKSKALNQLRDALNGYVDPVVKQGFLEKGVIGVAESIPTMALAATGYGGGFVLANSYGRENYYDRLDAGGPDNAATAAASAATGIMQAGVEMLQLKALKAIPGAGGLSRILQTPVGKMQNAMWSMNPALRAGGAYGVTVVAELTQEVIQDQFAPALADEMVHLVTGDHKRPDWSKALDDGLKSIPEMLPTMMMLSAIGTGAAEVGNAGALKDLLNTPALLEAAGFDASQAEAIRTAKNPAAELRAFWTARTGPAGSPVEVVQQAGQSLREAATATATAAQSVAEAAGVTVRRDEAGFHVVGTDGVQTFATGEAAYSSIVGKVEQQDAPLLDMLQALDDGSMSFTAEIGGERQSVAEYNLSRDAVANDPAATPEARAVAGREQSAMAERMKIYEAEHGDSVDWNAISVGGQSGYEVREGLKQAVIRVTKGEKPATVLEEWTEAAYSRITSDGKVSPDQIMKALVEVEALTGDTYLHGYTGGQDAKQDALAIKEAFSSLAIVHVTGKGRAGKPGEKAAGVLRESRMAERRRLREVLATGKVASWIVDALRAAQEFTRALVGKAVRLNRARRENGALEIDQWLNEATGLSADVQHAREVVAEAGKMFGDVAPVAFAKQAEADPDVGFSLTTSQKKYPLRIGEPEYVEGDYRFQQWEGEAYDVRLKMEDDPADDAKGWIEVKVWKLDVDSLYDTRRFDEYDDALAWIKKEVVPLEQKAGEERDAAENERAAAEAAEKVFDSSLREGVPFNSPKDSQFKSGKIIRHGKSSYGSHYLTLYFPLKKGGKTDRFIEDDSDFPNGLVTVDVRVSDHAATDSARSHPEFDFRYGNNFSTRGGRADTPTMRFDSFEDALADLPGVVGELIGAGKASDYKKIDIESLKRQKPAQGGLSEPGGSLTGANQSSSDSSPLGNPPAGNVNPDPSQPGFSLTYAQDLSNYLERAVRNAEEYLADLTDKSDRREIDDANTEALIEMFGKIPLPEGWEYSRRGEWVPSGQGSALNGRHVSSWYAAVEHSDFLDEDGEPVVFKISVRDHEQFSRNHESPDLIAIVKRNGGIVWEPAEIAKAIESLMGKLAKKSQSTRLGTMPGSGSEKTGFSPNGDSGETIKRPGSQTKPEAGAEISAAAVAQAAGNVNPEESQPGFSIGRAVPADPQAPRVIMPDGAELVGPTSFSIRAYHGTPHKVDRFSLEKIGTGEGAQAYGWGLYFAESKDVGAQYQRTLSAKYKPIDSSEDASKAAGLLGYHKTKKAALAQIKSDIADGYMGEQEAEKLSNFINAMESREGGNLYTVELLPDDADFLDWDKPLSEQSEKVLNALGENYKMAAKADKDFLDAGGTKNDAGWLERMKAHKQAMKSTDVGGGMNGAGVYKRFGNPEEAAAALMKRGIPGIRFLDGNSRSVGKGTYNYVIFDDKLVKILEENGKPAESQPSFSLSSVRTLEDVARQIERMTAGSPAKLETFGDMARTLSGMARAAAGNEETEKILRFGEIETERKAMRQALVDEYVTGVWKDNYAILGDNDLIGIRAQPTLAALLKSDKGRLAGRIISPAKAKRQGLWDPKREKGGDFDGMDGVPFWMFQGSDKAGMPDVLAAELGFASTDELWNAIHTELSQAGKNREWLRKAREALADATERAANEANAWAANERLKAQSSDKRDARRALVALDAMLLHLPAEVRGKVGGLSRMSELTTERQRAGHFRAVVLAADREMERYLRKELVTEIRSTIEKGQAKRKAGERDHGKIGVNGHTWLELADEAMRLSPEALDRQEKWIESTQAETELNPATIAELNRRWDFGTGEDAARLALEQEAGILDLFGGINHQKGGRYVRQSGELQAALDAAKDAVATGRRAYNEAVQERRERRAGRRAGLKLDSQNNGTAAEIQQREKELEGFGGAATRYFRKGFTFEQYVGEAFGRESDTHRWAEETVLNAEMVETTAFQDSQRGLANFLRSVIPGGTRKRLHVLEKLSTPKPIPGTAEGTPELSEMQAVHLSMLWADEDSQSWLTGHGYGEDFQSAVEKHLSPQALAIRGFLQSQYDSQYDKLNAVYRRQHGVNMPRVKNYAPREVMHGQTAQTLDPLGAGGLSARGVFSGFTKRRRIQIAAAPELRDALQSYVGNQRMVTHFLAWAEASADLRAVFATSETSPFIRASLGNKGQSDLVQWLTDLESGGVQDAQASELWQRWMRANADNALVGKLGVLAKQVPAMYGAAVEIGWSDYLRSARRLATGKAVRERSAAVESRIMQARGFQRPAEIGQAASGTGERPWRAKVRAMGIDLTGLDLSLEWLRNRIGAADAWFTATGAAIAYDSHYLDGIAQKMSEAEAMAYAEAQTEKTITRTAQPDTLANKSLAENHARLFGRMMNMFQSANRQSLFMTVAAFRAGGVKDARAWRMAATHWALTGIVSQSMGNIVRDMLTDDEKDDEIWQLGDYWRALAFGPASGAVQGLGPLVDVAASWFGGYERRLAPAPVAAMTTLGKEVADLIEDGEFDLKNADTISRAIGLFLAGQFSALNVSANVAKQAVGGADNLNTTPEEADAMKAKKESKLRKEEAEARKNAMSDKDKEAAKAQREAAKTKRIRDAAAAYDQRPQE